MLDAKNPATGEVIWQGHAGEESDVEAAMESARKGFLHWSRLTLDERTGFVSLYEKNLKENFEQLAHAISLSTGKPLWEAKTEVDAMIQKIPLSIAAFQERCPEKIFPLGHASLAVRHRPHGVAAVCGPFNFPGHLPNGHIVPALLAGNAVIFKGSEYTPLVSQLMVECWEDLPPGVLNLIQGGPSTGKLLSGHPQLDALFFTGSSPTGMALIHAFHGHPEKILALEMGGNNPLIVAEISDAESAAYWTIQSAFLTAGQRCTSARKLIVLDGDEGNAFLKILTCMASHLKVGPFTETPEPFMGPVISKESSERLLNAQHTLIEQGGIPLLEMRSLKDSLPFLSPGILDVTEIHNRKDEEIFGPLLQVIRTQTFEEAIEEANATQFGLSAAIFTKNRIKYQEFYQRSRAGVVNWNAPTTGASGKAPFGGLGKSGNHRPSGYYAADYCSYPVASMESEALPFPKEPTPGVEWMP